jgi:hypothetical protein
MVKDWQDDVGNTSFLSTSKAFMYSFLPVAGGGANKYAAEAQTVTFICQPLNRISFAKPRELTIPVEYYDNFEYNGNGEIVFVYDGNGEIVDYAPPDGILDPTTIYVPKPRGVFRNLFYLWDDTYSITILVKDKAGNTREYSGTPPVVINRGETSPYTMDEPIGDLKGQTLYDNQSNQLTIHDTTGPNMYINRNERYSDRYYTSYMQVSGDFDITVRVLSLENTAPDAVAGLMVSPDLKENGIRAALLVTPGNKLYFRIRTMINEPYINVVNYPYGAPDAWLRFRRVGSILEAYVSNDGINYFFAGTMTIGIDDLYVAYVHDPGKYQWNCPGSAVFGNAEFGSPGINPPEWDHTARLFINTSGTGVQINNNVYSFPLLVRLDESNFDFSEARITGSDIRFTDRNGISLAHEVEYWNAATKSAAVWVLAPVIYSDNSTQYINMHWGNSSVSDVSCSECVFNSSNGFSGVWHLNNQTIADATDRGNNGTNNQTTTEAGIIGNAAGFDAPSAQNITLPPGAISNVFGNISISLWSFGGSRIPLWANSAFEAVDANGNRLLNMHLPWDSEYMHWDFGNSTGCDRISRLSTSTEQKGQWNHWVFTHNSVSGEMKQYLNGTLWNSGSNRNLPMGIPSVFKLGSAAGNAFYYDGRIDEFSVANVERSADWIKLCYENQKINQSLIAFEQVPPEPEDYSEWSYHRQINLNTSTTGADITQDVNNFPVVIRLNESNFNFAQCLENGADIRFSLSDYSPLPFEVELWDVEDQKAVIWVKIPVVYGNNNSQHIIMHWGKTGVTAASNNVAVFGTGSDFCGVWHLQNTESMYDATGHGNTANNNGTTPAGGIIGDAIGLDVPNTQYVSIPPSALSDIEGAITLSLWVFGGNSIPLWANSVVDAADALGNRVLNIHLPWDSQVLHWDFGDANGRERISKATTTTEQKGQWNHWVFTHNAAGTGTMKVYLNGQLWNTGTGFYKSLGDAATFTLGSGIGGQFVYDGIIDEFQISKVEYSPAWIKLAYESQRENQTLVTIVP